MPDVKRRNLKPVTQSNCKDILEVYLKNKSFQGPNQGEQICEYIEDMVNSLAQLATRHGQPALAYFLKFAEDEARSARNRERLLSPAA